MINKSPFVFLLFRSGFCNFQNIKRQMGVIVDVNLPVSTVID